jgi:hypothetical protein
MSQVRFLRYRWPQCSRAAFNLVKGPADGCSDRHGVAHRVGLPFGSVVLQQLNRPERT